jgi:hypothetical protein
VSKGGYEYTLLLMTVSIALGLIGPGSYSLDVLFGIALPEALLFGLLISRPAVVAQAEVKSPAS